MSSDSDYSPVKKRKVTRAKVLLSSSSSSSDDDSDVPIRKRKSRRMMLSSSSDSDDSIIVNSTHKRLRVISDNDSDSSSSSSYESETEGEMRRINTETRRPGPRPVQAESNGCAATKKSDKSDTSDDESERCIICFKTFRGIIAHPSGCQHFFHSNCLQTWSKTSNTCPIDRVKYNSIILLGSNNEVVERIGVTTPPPQDHNNDLEPDDPTFCEVCHQHDREDEMLLCDRCDTGYHLNCLDPPLTEVPVGNWFCPTCAFHAADDDIDEDEVNDILREGAILESRMRRRAAVPSRRVGPRTRAVQRVLATIRQMAEETELYQPSSSTSRSVCRRVQRRKKSHRRRSTHYKVELVTVEDGSTIEVKVAVNTRTRRRKKKKSNASCGHRRKGGSKRSSASAGGMEGHRGRDSGIPSLDIMGSRPTLEYFSGCEAEDELEGDGGLSMLRARSSVVGVRGMANRKQIAAQLLRSAPRRPTPRIAVSSAPPDLLSSILDEQTKWHSPNAVIHSNRNGELRVTLPDKDKDKAPVRKAAGNGEASGSVGSSAPVKDSGGGERSGPSSSTSTVPPLQPPPQPPNFSRVYEDEDFDLYADIEPPRLAPPPEPPALLLALEGDEAASSPEDAALVIDDERQAYDPDLPTSPPPSPPPPENAEKTKKDADLTMKSVEATTDQIAIDLSSIRLPSPEPDIDDCPNRVFYSKASINIAKEKEDSDGEIDMTNPARIINKINLDSSSDVNKVLNNNEAAKADIKNTDVKDESPVEDSSDVKTHNKEHEEKDSNAVDTSDKYDPELSDEDEDRREKELSDSHVIGEKLIKENEDLRKNDDVKENAEQMENDSLKVSDDLKENVELKENDVLKDSDNVKENDDLKEKIKPKDESLEKTEEENDEKPVDIDNKDVEMLEGEEIHQKVDNIKEEEKMDDQDKIEEKVKEESPEEKLKLEEGELNSDEGELKDDEELKDEEGELKDDEEESKDEAGDVQKNKNKTSVKDKVEDNAELETLKKDGTEKEDSRPGSPNEQECNKNEKEDDETDINDKSPQRIENRSLREKRKDDSSPESTPPKKDAEEGEDVLELGCGDDERDGLVDITDEEISTYEKSWELEDNQAPNEKTAGLEGLETEAISEGEENMAEDGHARAAAENGPKEEGEIISDEKRVPVAWKKVTKAKDRSYREKESLKEKNKKKEKKPKEKRKELERYDVRKIISDKPKKRKVDEFGRDISPSRSRSLSDSRSRSRSLSVRSRSRRSRSRSRSRSRKRRSRERRARSRSRGRSRGRSRIRSRDRSRDRSKRRGRSKSKSRSGSRRRKSRSPRKKERRSRAKSREKKRRKRDSSISCSSCSCSSCERERRKSKKLTVIVPNEPAVRKDKKKSKYKDRGDLKRRRVDSPVPSKEVFTSGDNILVSVNFKSSKSGEVSRKEPSKKKRDEEPKKKKDKSSKENQPLRSIVSKSSNQTSRRSRLNARNLKPVAIIDLAQSPFREQTLSPKEIIVLTDSDSDDKRKPDENNIPVCQITGPKTPPEPHIKFNIISSKPQILRSLANPLLDSVDQLEGEGEEEEDERVDMPHKGPNTPPEPPVPYDPFEPTKSRSPTPLQELEESRNPPTPPGDKTLPPEPPQRPVSPPKPPPEPPKTPSPLHSPPPKPPEDIPTEKIHISPPNNCDDDSMDMGGGDSPYSPGSSGGGGDDDIFEPPLPQITTPAPMSKAKSRPGMKLPKLTPSPLKRKPGANKNSTPLKNNKGGKKESISMKLDEDQLKILDDLPNSAVEMQVKDKFLKKLNRQERVVEEVKMVLKPHYAKKHVNKEEYKEILRKSVPKICHSRSGEINPIKIQRLIEAYVKKYRHLRKKRKMATTNFSAPESIPLLKPKPKPTMWC